MSSGWWLHKYLACSVTVEIAGVLLPLSAGFVLGSAQGLLVVIWRPLKG